ncbi:thioesterase domain-containing protein [Nocardia sp. NPDC024068]|uniref:thioesterase domain-containing protein n=1 Tax=Nocardia sp. NPDC024068 TaxID=3157197 RepID=UPI003403122E
MTAILTASCPRRFRMPATSSERLVADGFAAVLLRRDPTYQTPGAWLASAPANRTAAIGLDENFFDLGGNSLVAEQLAIRLGSALAIDLPARVIVESPTVAALAHRIDELLTARGPAGALARHRIPVVDRSAFDMLLPLRTACSGTPLFCIHPITGIAWSFAGLAAHLGPDRPLYGLQSPALTAGMALPRSIEDWATLYIGVIRSVQPSGPYRLLGWSFGGVLAHEIAVQLQAAGHEITFLGVMDSYLTDEVASAGPIPISELLGGLLGDQPRDLGTTADFNPATAPELLARLPEPLASCGASRFGRLLDAATHSIRLRDAYRAPRYRGDVSYFHAIGNGSAAGAHRWRALVDGHVRDHEVPTTHWQMTSAAGLACIAEVLRAH